MISDKTNDKEKFLKTEFFSVKKTEIPNISQQIKDVLCTEKDKDDCRFLIEILQAGCQWNNILKVLKEEKSGQSRILYKNICVKNKGKSKDTLRNTKATSRPILEQMVNEACCMKLK